MNGCEGKGWGRLEICKSVDLSVTPGESPGILYPNVLVITDMTHCEIISSCT